MPNNENYITVDAFNNGIQELKQDFKSSIQELKQDLKAEIQEIKTDIRVLQSDTAHLQTSVYWGFAIIAIVIAFFALFKNDNKKQEKKQTFTENQVIEIRSLIRDEFARLKAGN